MPCNALLALETCLNYMQDMISSSKSSSDGELQAVLPAFDTVSDSLIPSPTMPDLLPVDSSNIFGNPDFDFDDLPALPAVNMPSPVCDYEGAGLKVCRLIYHFLLD